MILQEAILGQVNPLEIIPPEVVPLAAVSLRVKLHTQAFGALASERLRGETNFNPKPCQRVQHRMQGKVPSPCTALSCMHQITVGT